ncbi:Terminase small subunit (gp1) [Escherichia coli]|nr:Terminase small subunit (gp1) [Escherichia coli]SQS87503.1 Terminase small subunit (gp1) [Escherichia coli]
MEVTFDSAQVIEWYVQRGKEIENEKLRMELDDLRAAGESDLQPGTTEYERYRLTRAQDERGVSSTSCVTLVGFSPIGGGNMAPHPPA